MTEPQIGFTGLPDADALVLLELPYSSLIRICQASKYLYSICQDPHFWKQKIIKDYGSQVLQYMMPKDSFFRFYDALTKIPRYYNLNILRYRVPGESLERFLDELSGQYRTPVPSDFLPRNDRFYWIRIFTDLMEDELAGKKAHVIDVGTFKPKSVPGFTMYSSDLALPRNRNRIRPVIIRQDKQIYAPLMVNAGKKSKLIDFLNEIVAYSKYSDLVPEMLQSIQ